MFDEENLILLAILLSFCEIFALFYRKIFALFFRKILHFFAKQIQAKFRGKEKCFHFLGANKMRKWSEMVVKKKFCEKCNIFAKRFFIFAENPSTNTNGKVLLNWLALMPRRPMIGIESYLDWYGFERYLWSSAFNTVLPISFVWDLFISKPYILPFTKF